MATILIAVGAGGWFINPELFSFFPNGFPANERYPLADAGSLKDNKRMVYAMKIEIGRAWPTIKGDKGSSADDQWV